ncbi:MAG TPA: glycosyltransferase, partial [Gemmataceae bacterium]|nr:glycosyltransferase [Gemmataceae bacterium]
VLHDYFVRELVLRAIDQGIWQTTLDTELAGETTAELTRHRAGGLSRQQLVDRVPLNRRVLTAADAVIVHTAWTWQCVRERTQAPVARIPHHALIPSLGSREDERARLGLPQGAFLIATLGFVATPKRILVLFQAVAGLPAELKGRTKLLVVGGVQQVDERELLALANRLGIAAHVRFTGHVPLGDFAAYARAADVCVQLRYPTRGEAPGSLLRAMSSGTACVISDHGPMAEVPEEAALRVRTPDHEIDDLRAALRRLDENPALRNALGQAAVRFLREQHGIDKTVEQYALMIEETASQRRSRDALWTERVCESLALRPDSAIPDRLFESWAELRSRGQQAIGSGRQKPRDRQLLSEPAPQASLFVADLAQ